MTRPLPHVLIVDDNHDAADSLGDLLALCGADVRTRYDAAGALDAVGRFAFEAAVLDIHMPVTDGCTLARLLRKAVSPRHIFLIALTGVSDHAARTRTAAAGFDLHLTKGDSSEALLQALGQVASAAR